MGRPFVYCLLFTDRFKVCGGFFIYIREASAIRAKYQEKNAESLQFLMVVDFPRSFTQAALEKLENVMSNSPKNGIYTILAGEYNEISGNNTANDPRYGVKRI